MLDFGFYDAFIYFSTIEVCAIEHMWQLRIANLGMKILLGLN
jgi:hypothetical protein